MRSESMISSSPIHLACFQSVEVSRPICHIASRLQAETFPALSHTITFQKYFFADSSFFPLYATWIEDLEMTFFESQILPAFFCNKEISSVTRILYAVCTILR